jgi:DNA-binding LacI/PurR family transcriptional regulator
MNPTGAGCHDAGTMGSRDRGRGRVTLEQVAELAGVSRGTASRVLSGASNVSDHAVEAVRAAAAELSYRPNLAARSLVTGRTGLVGLVVNESEDRLFSDPYFAQVARGAHAALAEADTALVLALASDDEERARLLDVAALRLDGLLVVHGHGDPGLVRRIVSAGIPAVFAGRTEVEDAHVSWVDSDNVAGSRAAAEHLIARGCRTVACLSGPLDMVAGADRLAGWRAALDDAGLDPAEELVEPGAFSTESGRAAMAALLERVPDLDGVVVGSDLMAIGALGVLREHGRRVPDDVAVVGYDDVEAAATSSPPLTTVAQDIEGTGRRMAELLLARLSGDDTPRQEVLPTRLVARASA